jgi:hypothetical protein
LFVCQRVAFRIEKPTGASGNYAPESALPYMVNIVPHTADPTSKPIRVELPNGQIIQSTHTALPTLPQAARKAHIFRDLQCDTLISVGVLCDAGLVATFTADDVTFYYGPHIVLQGKRNKVTQLWDLNISPDAQPNVPPGLGLAATTIQFQTTSQAIAWFHACFGYPVKTTFHTTTKNNWKPIPRLTAKAIRSHCPISIPSSKGHLNQQQLYIKLDQPVKLVIDSKCRIISSIWKCTGRIHSDGTISCNIKLRQALYDNILREKTVIILILNAHLIALHERLCRHMEMPFAYSTTTWQTSESTIK